MVAILLIIILVISVMVMPKIIVSDDGVADIGKQVIAPPQNNFRFEVL